MTRKNLLWSQHTWIFHLLITSEFVQLIMVSFCCFLFLQLFPCSSVSFPHTTLPSGIFICYAKVSLWAAVWTSALPRTIPPYPLWHLSCFSLCSFLLLSQSVVMWLFVVLFFFFTFFKNTFPWELPGRLGDPDKSCSVAPLEPSKLTVSSLVYSWPLLMEKLCCFHAVPSHISSMSYI